MTTDVTLRPYRRADARHVVDVINADATQTVGFRRAVVDGVGNVRLSRYVSVTSEKVVAINGHAEIVGYAYLTNAEHGIISEVGGAVHPENWGRGVGTMLLNWAEQRAQALTDRAPPGVRTVLQANVYEAQHETIRLLTQAGFAKVREWAHLVVDMVEPPPVPTVPDNMVIRAMDLDEDWDIVGPAMDEAYTDHWGAISLPFVVTSSDEEQLQEVLEPEDDSYSNAPGVCFIALAGDTVAGGVLCNAKLVERADTGRVGSLFVRPQYRRHGIGRALILTAFNAFWERGVRRIITDTDAESFTETPKFYARVGMRLYRREYLYEKEVCPGTEVRRLRL